MPASYLAPLRAALLASDPHDVVQRALRAVRAHLGLQVAYVSEFIGDEAVFRTVDAPGLEHLIKPGDRRSLDEVYCRHILAGTLPELIPDTSREPVAAAMPITDAIPIGAHVSVPLRLDDGQVYGMFCCLGPAADSTLGARDLAMMRAFAELAAFEIRRERQARAEQGMSEARIRDVLADEAIDMVFQPIWSLSHGRALGVEALARVRVNPSRTPDQWFAEAAAVGMGAELELLAVRRAIATLPDLPHDLYVAVNVSPATIVSPRFLDAIAAAPAERLVLEITEHDAIEDVDVLVQALAPLRAAGMRLAIDDAGAGYSGLQQILQLRPDLIKLDRFLIRDIQNDPGRRALAAALTVFARETGSRLIAEGVETDAELAMLKALGVEAAQGYLLGRPVRPEHLCLGPGSSPALARAS